MAKSLFTVNVEGHEFKLEAFSKADAKDRALSVYYKSTFSMPYTRHRKVHLRIISITPPL